jgi:hypothetical protein
LASSAGVYLALSGRIMQVSSTSSNMGNNTETSSSSSPEVRISVGYPTQRYYGFNFSTYSSVSFIGEEVIPLEVSASVEGNYDLRVNNLPDGTWASFDPSIITLGPSLNGNASLLIAGSVITTTLPPGTEPTTIVATGPSGIEGVAKMNLEGTYGVSVLGENAPLAFKGSCSGGANQTSYCVFGSVFFPNSSQQSRVVGLTIIGLRANGTISPSPKSMNLTFPVSSFTLSQSIPYYFAVKIITHNAQAGSYDFVVSETIGGTTYQTDLVVIITPTIHL